MFRKIRASAHLSGALIFFLVFSSALSATEISPGKSFYEEGLQLKEKRAFEDAIPKFKQAIELEPANPDYHFELANVYAGYYDSLKTNPKNARGAELLENAAAELRQATMSRPDHIPAHYNLGVVLKRQGKFEAAREEFKNVLELDPRQVSARMQLGATYEDQGFYDEAKTEYETARELYANSPEIQGALEDLEKHKTEAHERMLQETTPSYWRYREPIEFGRQSYQAGRYAPRDQAGLAAAVPYVASYLIQEFMKLRKKE